MVWHENLPGSSLTLILALFLTPLTLTVLGKIWFTQMYHKYQGHGSVQNMKWYLLTLSLDRHFGLKILWHSGGNGNPANQVPS